MADNNEESTQPRDGAWAHPYTLKSGQTQCHELSQTRLWVTRLDLEWQIRSETVKADADPMRWTEQISHVLPGTEVPLQRFVKPDDSNELVFLPALANLPTVIRPYQPLTIPAGGECTIYVGTVVWMQVCVGRQRMLLAELALSEPSQTWVGRNTMEGELCYSAPSFARLVLKAVPKRPWRAITPVKIVNRRPEPLLLERFSLPTPLLSLHQNERGQLWTPAVTVVCETEMNSASLNVEHAVIKAAGTCKLVSPAREKGGRGRLVRTFDRMFG